VSRTAVVSLIFRFWVLVFQTMTENSGMYGIFSVDCPLVPFPSFFLVFFSSTEAPFFVRFSLTQESSFSDVFKVDRIMFLSFPDVKLSEYLLVAYLFLRSLQPNRFHFSPPRLTPHFSF